MLGGSTPPSVADPSPDDLRAAGREIAFTRALAHRRQQRPDEWYQPSPGQLAFHRATQPIRLLVPGNGWGKAVRHGETVLTAGGWVPIERIRVGDLVVGADGAPTEVLGVYPQGVRDIFRVLFDDGAALHVDGEHLWTVQMRDNRFRRPAHPERYGQWQTLTTSEIVRRVGPKPLPSSRPALPSVKPVRFAAMPVPMDPYALGLLIGDGGLTSRSAVRFSTADPELAQALNAAGLPTAKVPTAKHDYNVRRAWNALKSLGLAGKRSERKFVPTAYLWNEEAVRRGVLAGLMDTDGSAMENKHEFCSTSERLADDVVFLVRSLGGVAIKCRPRRTWFSYKEQRRQGLPSWRVSVWMDECPFRMGRKRARWRPVQTKPGRILREITPAGRAEATCIRVAAPDGLFVAADFIVTHNTTAMAIEANAFATHSARWQPVPTHPVLMLWFARAYAQVDLLRVQLQANVFGRGAEWRATDQQWRWPDGSVLVVGSADRATDWTRWQGVPADLVCFDEEPPLSLWREMAQRRRTDRKTRYVLAATATEGGSWMEQELYRPWLEHHQARGLDEERAIAVNDHPETWCLSIGGIDDNPGADAKDHAWYHNRRWGSEEERRVRLRGGFWHGVGSAVFDAEGLAWMRAESDKLPKGQQGFLKIAAA